MRKISMDSDSYLLNYVYDEWIFCFIANITFKLFSYNCPTPK